VKLYISMFRSGQPPTLIKQGLSWRVLIFGWIGLLLHGAWISGLIAGAASLLCGLSVHGGTAIALTLATHLGLATFTSELRIWECRLGGATPGPTIAATTRDAAFQRLCDQHPTIVQPARAAA